ncbi:MAG: TIGR03915 family putative DNA repair protein [Deltaproteobacteria bacterium]|nr:TIGR03915 family putative DNA repair protein [Deltaproteobacteria bacterium]
MRAFVYDRSFEGLLSAVFDAYALKSFPEILCGPADPPLPEARSAHRVEVTPEKPVRVFAALAKKLSERGLRNLILVWLSEEKGSDFLLFRFIRKIFDAGSGRGLPERDFGDPDVLAVERLARRVGRKAERYAGFARFQKTRQGVYVALIEPEHNVLPLLLRHFGDRFGDRPWMLYDVGRGYGIMRDSGNRREEFREVFLDERLIEGGGLRPDLLAEGEELLQSLWRGYHEAAAVRERLNPRLQRGFMPKKFWKYLTEFP